ncbi:universal stress protein [Maribacter luteus]|uniref:Universal stress protein n=1 Tax=Maribacter luteus TaxID=2594478 RepID=A0A6I2MRD0_9FLAO|nr:universal stress protein [Maribacter luteus]MRX66208.1 universal stress protein [Maribacter luteus]|tara:strand:+ start:1079 stop:1915 length:837 start_codon:yes stop_codon:yes gene_type:complete
MDKILVPVDFSEFSENALEVAAHLASKFNADLILLHMLGLSEAIFTKNEAQEFMEAQYYMKLAKKRFNEFLDKPYLKGVKVFEIVQNYKDFNEMNNVVKERNIDLVVMGSHGVTGLTGLFVGSNTEKVVRNCSVPVLVIKKKRKDFDIKKAVFASDFGVEHIGVYMKAMNFFNKLKVEVHKVYINRPNQYFRSTEEIKEQIGIFMRTAHHGENPSKEKVTILNDYSIEQGIYNYAQKIDADIIALPTQGRKGLSHFFKGSIGEDIANRADLPVITFKV